MHTLTETTHIAQAENPVARFLADETGAVLLEYVTLLIGCFLAIHIMIQPLREAFIQFMTDAYEGMTLP
jgi:hypothetical protein